MATGNVRGLVNDLENMCECSICYIEYDEQKKVPRMLPCQHTFCTECLSKQCKGQKLKCFLCSKEHHVENKDINIFPKDNTRRNLRDLLEKYWQSTCGVCRRHDQAKYFCATCNIRMCRGCYKERKSSGCCNTHDVHIPEDSSLTPDTSLDLNDMQSKNVCLLSGHENNELKYFCSEKSCCKAICANCVIESHKEHAYMTVKDEYENRKKYMLNKCQAITDKIVKASLLLKNVEKECETLKKGDSLGRKSLSAEAELGILYIKDFEENAKKKTSETLQKNLSTLEKKKEELRCFIENAKECCAVSEEALNGNNFISFFSVEKTLTDKLNCFEESKVDKPLEPMPETDFELQNAILELRQRINQMRRDKHENEEQNWFQRFKSKFWNSRRKQKRPWYCSLLSWFRLLVLVVLLALNMAPDIPYASVFQINRADVAFPNGKSSLMCYAVDTKTISTMPIENMLQTCGNPQNLFIYRGAFTNTSFLYRNESLLFSIHVFEIKKYSPGLILFEFGVSKASIERKHIHGLQSADFYGWFLKILDSDGKVALINTEGQTVQTRVISDHNKAAFPFIIKLNSNRKITLKTKMKGTKAYKILDETKLIKGKPKLGFAKVCDSSDASVYIKILNDDVAFNATTLYPNVYISNDNKSLSNTQFQNFSEKEIKNGSIYQDVEILNCRNECVYVIDFRVFSPHSINSFTLVLTNSKFLPSATYRNVSILSYEKCTVRNLFKFQSYCLNVDKDLQSGMYSGVEMKPNLWHRLTIMMHRKSQKASFFFGNIKIELQNGSIIGSGTPILRWVMQNANVNVEIKFSENDDFSIFTWFYYKMTPFINCLTSILPFSPGFSGWLIRIVVTLSFVLECFADFANYVYDKYFGQDRVYVTKPETTIRRPRRGIRHRNR